jgi:hypothetical protein
MEYTKTINDNMYIIYSFIVLSNLEIFSWVIKATYRSSPKYAKYALKSSFIYLEKIFLIQLNISRFDNTINE